MTEKMWAGRFREPLDPAFDQWQRSFSFDRRLLPDEVAASRAWASALGLAGVFSSEEVKAVRDVLLLIEQKAAEDPGSDVVDVVVAGEFAAQGLQTLVR